MKKILSQIDVNLAIFWCSSKIFTFNQTLNTLLDDDGRWKETTSELSGDVRDE